ncbi:uncharacterized protein LOC110463803 [Mizuhopecten yessoensis]|uniref:uncharacterized protein LOC110463803 n=1 Tax=Mizuhopecten yessoensis TaxID=6573 RepID=UPI000B45F366|nr:uncharacterized protein LOC110463803 [Mizuhopecten yessoensis]
MLDYTHTSKMADRRKPKRPYIETLDAAARQRYIAKTSTIGNLDPYTIDTNRFSTDASILPSVSYPDIVNFLLYSPSPYTLEDLRCYKGLAAYNQFVNGWVRDVRATVIDGYHLVLGRVMHSQRLSETPLKPWVIAENSGKINSCHCDCVAGLGETCTHVSALLFYVDTKVRIRDSATVTQSAAYWKLPASVRGASYLPAFDVDFTSSKTKKKQLDSLVGNNVNLTPGKRQIRQVEAPSQERVNSLFEALKIRGSKAAVLRVVPGYSEDFVPDAANPNFPSVLTDLYSGNFTSLSLDELINKSEEVTESINVTKEEARSVEEATRPQSKTKLWNKFRSGRLTASKIKKVCRTSIQHPSRSLIQSVCYPGNNSFANNATKWGLEHEETAKKAYLQRMEETHDNFRMTQSGFVINPKFPLFGASPDALISCDCCGSGVLEVKCPYSGIGMSSLEYAESAKNPCVMKCGDSLTLGSHHDYMYQVQCQMHVCEVDYAICGVDRHGHAH